MHDRPTGALQGEVVADRGERRDRLQGGQIVQQRFPALDVAGGARIGALAGPPLEPPRYRAVVPIGSPSAISTTIASA